MKEDTFTKFTDLYAKNLVIDIHENIKKYTFINTWAERYSKYIMSLFINGCLEADFIAKKTAIQLKIKPTTKAIFNYLNGF